jgi:drug/metabolite transporter (DMT)-like permease
VLCHLIAADIHEDNECDQDCFQDPGAHPQTPSRELYHNGRSVKAMTTRGIVQSLLAVLLWSVLAFLSLQLSRMPPFLLIGIALCVGSLCGVHRIRQWRVPLRVLLLGVYGLFGFHLCLFLALRLAPPVEANLINYLWPLLIVVLSPLFVPGLRLAPRHIAAAILGLAGAALIVTGGRFGFQARSLPGYALAAAAAFIWASYSLLSGRIRSFPNAAIGLFCLCAGVLSLLIHFLLEPRYALQLKDLPLLAALGVGPMGAAFFLWNAGLRNGDPRVIGSFAYITPMLSSLVLILGGSGRITVLTGAAMALIIGGSVIGSLDSLRPVEDQRQDGRGAPSA